MSARVLVRLFAICALFNLGIAAQAGTIIKLDLGNVGPDIGMDPGHVLATMDDGIAATTGSQNTNVEFTDFLSAIPSITNSTASFTLLVTTSDGLAQQFGSLAVQNFTSDLPGFPVGLFTLYDSANNLLLSAPIGASTLTGVIGPPGTASLFTTTLSSSLLAGSLAPLIAPGTVSLSLSMTNVNGGDGLSIMNGILQPFVADASVLIAANPSSNAPEPSTLALLTLGGVIAFAARRRCPRINV